MTAVSYLPSRQFSLIIGSIALSLSLIFGAQYYTAPHSTSSSLTATPGATVGDPDWQATLEQVQTEAAIAAPQTPDPDVVDKLKEAAKSTNITDSVARTLFVSLSSAKAEGLGDDLPTQDKLIAEASSQLQTTVPPIYTSDDVRTAATNKDTLRAYGNAVMTVINAHPGARVYETYVAIGEATDNNDKRKLAPLKEISAEYNGIAEDLILLPVPATLAPLHLKVTNDFAAIAATYDDLRAIGADPLRGIAGLQSYQFYLNETSRLFT
ncbi:hypothetical protein EXS62_02845, partial [Candidatus Kaiserbacteria bacterium]|nr:hypothetical protein [Candidatus Kaiserbacteria bacterium]